MSLILLLLTVACGAGAAYVRSRELADAFIRTTSDDAIAIGENGLSIPWHTLTVLMVALTVVFAVLLVLTSLYAKSKDKFIKPNMAQWVFRLLAGLVLTGVGLYDASLAVTQSPSSMVRILYALFTIIAGLSVLVPAVQGLRGIEMKLYSFTLLIPAFWGCFRLISTFFQQSSNPVINSFVYALFSDIALLLAMYFLAGLYFGYKRAALLRISGGLAAYFGCISLFGPLLYQWAGHSLSTLPDAMYIKNAEGVFTLTGAGVFAFAILFGCSMLLADKTLGPGKTAIVEKDSPTPVPEPTADEPTEPQPIEAPQPAEETSPVEEAPFFETSAAQVDTGSFIDYDLDAALDLNSGLHGDYDDVAEDEE